MSDLPKPYMAIEGMRSWLAAQIRTAEKKADRRAFRAALDHLSGLVELWNIDLDMSDE